MKIHPVKDNQFHAERPTNRRKVMTKQISAFLNFAKAPEMNWLPYIFTHGNIRVPTAYDVIHSV
jgi:hypothetical protein